MDEGKVKDTAQDTIKNLDVSTEIVNKLLLVLNKSKKYPNIQLNDITQLAAVDQLVLLNTELLAATLYYKRQYNVNQNSQFPRVLNTQIFNNDEYIVENYKFKNLTQRQQQKLVLEMFGYLQTIFSAQK